MEQITTTIWVRLPGDNRWNGAGWGKPQKVEITAETNAESLEVGRIIYDALQKAGIELISSRP